MSCIIKCSMVDLGRNSMTVSCLMNSSLLAHNELDAVSNEYRNNLRVAGQNF